MKQFFSVACFAIILLKCLNPTFPSFPSKPQTQVERTQKNSTTHVWPRFGFGNGEVEIDYDQLYREYKEFETSQKKLKENEFDKPIQNENKDHRIEEQQKIIRHQQRREIEYKDKIREQKIVIEKQNKIIENQKIDINETKKAIEEQTKRNSDIEKKIESNE